MKKVFTLKNFMLALGLVGAGVANGQIHPLAFGPFPYGTGSSDANWYKDYVGLRFVVNSPASVAGPKVYTHPGVGTTPWGATVTTPINNVQIIMPPVGGDTLATAALAPGSMTGRIGYVYRGGGVEFVCKAKRCQDAGAIAVVIVNNVNGGPIGMGAGSICPSAAITVPCFMISKEDGDPITARFRANDTARMTITPWGLGLGQDLGFVPEGVAGWHSYAVPADQLGASGNPAPYNMLEGAFIANYGLNNSTNVRLTSTTAFAAGGTGTPVVQHTSTVTLSSFPAADSIYAMFPTSEFSPSATGKGRFDVTYNVSSDDFVDEYPQDNTVVSSFYVTDSLFSKGRYDFTNNIPTRTIGYSFGASGGDFIWGPLYYVKNPGTSISRVQYSLSTNAGGPLSTAVNIFLFKWVDGSNSQPQDSILQNGELELVSLGVHNFDGVNDTSGATLNFNKMGDPTSGNPMNIPLTADSWYYLTIGVPASHFLGADGVTHPLPRIFGRAQINPRWLDYQSLVNATVDDIAATPAGNNAPMPGTFSSFVNVVDSFNFPNTKGLIPAVAMYTKVTPISVPASPLTSNVKVSLFPNPAKDNMKVSLELEKTSKSVTFTIIDGLGRFVRKETHQNVKSQEFNVNTSDLAAGHYFFVINTDEKALSRDFVIIK